MAARKSLQGIVNPAMQFITTEPAREAAAPEIKEEKVIISAKDCPQGYRPDYRFIETKSKQLKLTVQPSLYERVKKAAASSNLSMNEYVNQLLQAATKEE